MFIISPSQGIMIVSTVYHTCTSFYMLNLPLPTSTSFIFNINFWINHSSEILTNTIFFVINIFCFKKILVLHGIWWPLYMSIVQSNFKRTVCFSFQNAINIVHAERCGKRCRMQILIGWQQSFLIKKQILYMTKKQVL